VNGVVRLPVPAFARTDTSATDRSELEPISSSMEVASHPSDGSCELLSVPSDDEPETPEPTEAGDVAALDVAGGRALAALAQGGNQQEYQAEDIVGGLAAHCACAAVHNGAGGNVADAVAPRRHGGRSTARARASLPQDLG
jgi:hypothetical protein